LVFNLNNWSVDRPNGFLPNTYFSGWGAGSHGNRQASTRYLQNAAFARLKQITVGYTLPEKWVTKVAMSQARIYCTIQNLATWTKLASIYDPETTNLNSYPVPLSYNFGINLTF
jgi:hypothetical protein